MVEACSICKSRRFHMSDLGYYVCDYGHVQAHMVDQRADEWQSSGVGRALRIPTQSRQRTKRQVAEDEEMALLSAPQNSLEVMLVQCKNKVHVQVVVFQNMLKLQLEWLRRHKIVSLKFCNVVKRLWFLNVQQLQKLPLWKSVSESAQSDAETDATSGYESEDEINDRKQYHGSQLTQHDLLILLYAGSVVTGDTNFVSMGDWEQLAHDSWLPDVMSERTDEPFPYCGMWDKQSDLVKRVMFKFRVPLYASTTRRQTMLHLRLMLRQLKCVGTILSSCDVNLEQILRNLCKRVQLPVGMVQLGLAVCSALATGNKYGSTVMKWRLGYEVQLAGCLVVSCKLAWGDGRHAGFGSRLQPAYESLTLGEDMQQQFVQWLSQLDDGDYDPDGHVVTQLLLPQNLTDATVNDYDHHFHDIVDAESVVDSDDEQNAGTAEELTTRDAELVASATVSPTSLHSNVVVESGTSPLPSGYRIELLNGDGPVTAKFKQHFDTRLNREGDGTRLASTNRFVAALISRLSAAVRCDVSELCDSLLTLERELICMQDLSE